MSGWETYRHEAEAWTVGQLRRATEGLPDDWPVRVWVAEEPGGEFVTDQVVINTGTNHGWRIDGQEVGDYFELGCEFPPGDYERWTDDR